MIEIDRAAKELRRKDSEDAAAKAIIKIGLGIMLGIFVAISLLAILGVLH